VIATLRRLLVLAGAPRSRVALAVGLGAATVLFGTALLATSGYLISRAAERPAILSLSVAIVGVRFFGLGRPILRYAERLASHDLAFRVLGRVRARAYARMEPLAPAGLEAFREGELLSTAVADVDSLQNLHLRAVGPPLVAVVAGTIAVAAAAVFLPAAGLVLAAGLVVGAIAVPAAAAALGRRAGAQEADARGALTGELVELMRGAPELALYGQTDERLERVRVHDARLVRLSHRRALADGAGDGLMTVVAGATVAGVLAVALAAHAHGALDRVLIALLALLALGSFEAVQPLPAAARELSATVAAGRRVLRLLDREPAVIDLPDPAPAPRSPFEVALEDVYARYAPAAPDVLAGVSLRLDPGERVALVGASGAGKSTVARLLLRFLDPAEGQVTLGGIDLRRLRQEDVRTAVAVAGQDDHLFSTSIRENLRLARPVASDDELEVVLRDVGLWPWIAGLPDGLDTRVGEQGRELSGGQQRRLVVARALLARAAVLVLDEPTAHLDPEGAEALVRDVFAAAGGHTVLLITHRPEGLHLVDRVLVLEAGRISPAA
jgi:thiol reductant ABC exporter CydC subunit